MMPSQTSLQPVYAPVTSHPLRSGISGQSGPQKGALLLLLFFIFFQIDSRNIANIVPAYHLLRFTMLGVFMVGLILIFQREFFQAMKSPVWLPLNVMGIYQIISALWSDSMFEGAFFGVLCFVMFLSTIAVGAGMRFAKILDTYLKAALLCTAIGALFAVFVPSWGVESKFLLAGDWRGLANQKNLFGYFAGLGFVIAFLRAVGWQKDLWRGSRLLQMLIAAFFLAMILLSGSRGGLFCAILLVFVFWVLNMRIRRSQIIAGAVIILFVSSAVIYFNSELGVRGVTIFGVYVDASNRFLLWSYGFRDISDILLYGYGRSGFWTNERSDGFILENEWVLENFHNGYVTLFVEGGIIGISLFLIAFFVILYTLFSGYRQFRGSVYPLAIAALLSFLLYCFYEAVLGRTPQLSAFFAMALTSHAVNLTYSAGRTSQNTRLSSDHRISLNSDVIDGPAS